MGCWEGLTLGTRLLLGPDTLPGGGATRAALRACAPICPVSPQRLRPPKNIYLCSLPLDSHGT